MSTVYSDRLLTMTTDRGKSWVEVGRLVFCVPENIDNEAVFFNQPDGDTVHLPHNKEACILWELLTEKDGTWN